jgi:hypothetical protein
MNCQKYLRSSFSFRRFWREGLLDHIPVHDFRQLNSEAAGLKTTGLPVSGWRTRHTAAFSLEVFAGPCVRPYTVSSWVKLLSKSSLLPIRQQKEPA